MKKIFATHISNKQLESRKLKQHLQVNNNTNISNNKKWARNFIIEDVEMANKDIKTDTQHY